MSIKNIYTISGAKLNNYIYFTTLIQANIHIFAVVNFKII